MSFKIKNFSMRAFNNDVNNSGDPGDKYTEWAAYRSDVTDFIRSAVSKTPRAKSIIVFGAGECNDLDLGFLADTFERIVLSDVDAQSIHDGLLRQGLSDSSRFEVLQIEYTGLAAVNFFDTLSALCSSGASVSALSEFIASAFQNVRAASLPSLTSDGFDIVLSCPIYTQLVFTQAKVLMEILAHYSTYTPGDMHTLVASFSAAMPALIQKYNDLLVSMQSPNGSLIVLSDVIEAHPSDELLQKICAILSAQPGDSHALEHIAHDHGLVFGQLGRDDLLHKIDVADFLWSIWPFDERRAYLVSGVVGRKK